MRKGKDKGGSAVVKMSPFQAMLFRQNGLYIHQRRDGRYRIDKAFQRTLHAHK